MEVADEALQDAGLTRDTIPNNTGVYIGMGIIDFPGATIENKSYYNAHTLPGFTHTLSANRVSYHYGLTGPSVALDTACAASLTSIHVGCMSLWNRECDMGIVGATSNLYAPETTVAFSHLGVLSPTGNSAPFDVTNNGYVRGEGTGIVVLRPLEEALKNDDHIYCVIRGTTSAHNGYSMSLTLPSADAQQELISRCYDQFKIPIEKIQFVEAHGTGTPVGDPIETVALGNTFGKAKPKDDPLKICSSKSNFGHLEVAAGMVQVIKAAIMIEKKKYYKQTKWTSPNPRIDFEKLNLSIQTKEEQFVADDNFLIGINTFGFGGSLVHMVFEECPQKKKELTEDQKAGWSFGKNGKGRKIPVILSGKTKQALRNTAQKWMQFTNDADAQEAVGWQATRRAHHPHKAVILANSCYQFRANLVSLMTGTQNPDVILSTDSDQKPPRICLVFSGYTQQWDDMGRCLYANEPFFRRTVDECDIALEKVVGWSALEKYKIFIPEGNGQMPAGLIDREACKPAILFLQVGLTELFRHWGVKIDAVVGVGLGELSAAIAANAIALDSAMQCMKIRMGAPPKESFISQMKAVVNGPKAKTMHFYSTITGAKYEGTLDADYWWKNVAAPKQLEQTFQSVLDAEPNTYFLEISGSPVLLPKIQEAIDLKKSTGMALCCGGKRENDWDKTLQAMAHVYCAGHQLNWTNITRSAASYVPVPLYAWDHQVIRLESIEYIGRRCGVDDRSFVVQNGILNIEKHAYLRDYTLGAEQVFPTAGYIEYLVEQDESDLACLQDIEIKKNITITPLHPDGFINDTKLVTKKNGLKFQVFSDEDDLLAEGSISGGNTDCKPKLDLTEIKTRCNQKVGVREMYATFTKQGLVYSREFKLLHTLYTGFNESIGWTDGSSIRHERLNTPVLDTAFQVAMAAFGKGPGLYFPQKVQHLQMFVPKIPAHQKAVFYSKLTDWSSKDFTADISICDVAGNVMVQIEGFVAHNLTSRDTGVNLAKCMFTTVWQPIESSLPSTKIITSSTQGLEKVANIFSSHVKKLLGVSAIYCKETIQEGMDENLISPEKKGLHDDVRRLASKVNGIQKEKCWEELENVQELSSEVSLLKANISTLSSILSTQSDDKFTLGQSILDYLNESTVLNEYYSHISYVVCEGVEKALDNKRVVRIGQIGDSSSMLTRCVVSRLQQPIEDGRVEFIYMYPQEDHFQDIQNSLVDLPDINYDLMSYSHPPDEHLASFDILLSFDPLGLHSEHIEDLSRYICNSGWLVLMEIVKELELINLLMAGNGPTKVLSVIEWSKQLRLVGLSEIRSLNPKPLPFALFVGCKSSKLDKDISNESYNIVISNKPVEAEEVTDLIPASAYTVTCSTVMFIGMSHAYLPDVDSDLQTPVNVLIVWDDEMTLSDVRAICEIIQKYPQSGNMRISFIVRNNQRSMYPALCGGMLKSIRMENKLHINITELCSDDQGDLSLGVKCAIENSHRAEQEIRIRDGQILVPRLIQANIATTITNTSPSNTLMPKSSEVCVDVKCVAKYGGEEGCLYSFAGDVQEVGTSVTTVGRGDHVIALGTIAADSTIILTSELVVKKPVAYGYMQAAETLLLTAVARYILQSKAEIKPGDTVLVYPPHTPLGQAALMVAKDEEANVICLADDNTCSHPFGQFIGIALMADPTDASLSKDLLKATHGDGISVILHTGSSDLPTACLEALAYGGRIYSRSNIQTSLCPGFSGVILPMLTETDVKLIQKGIKTSSSKLMCAGIHPISTFGNRYATEGGRKEMEIFSSREITSQTEQISRSSHLFNAGGTCLVTGGYGRLGQELCRWLVSKGARCIAIMSRSGCGDCFKKSIKNLLEKNHVRLCDFRADVSQKTQVVKVITELCDDHSIPPLCGVFHLAGHASEAGNWNNEVIESMISSQAKGARNLHSVILEKDIQLDHFVLFSSSSVNYGDPNLPGSNTVGSYLDSLSEYRHDMGLSALSVQLGLVRGAGGIWENTNLYEALEQTGVKSLHIDEVLSTLSKLLLHDGGPPVVAITHQASSHNQ